MEASEEVMFKRIYKGKLTIRLRQRSLCHTVQNLKINKDGTSSKKNNHYSKLLLSGTASKGNHEMDPIQL